MSELTKKRDNFRERIRKEQIQMLFQQKRNQLMKQQKKYILQNQSMALKQFVTSFTSFLRVERYEDTINALIKCQKIFQDQAENFTLQINDYPHFLQFIKTVLQNKQISSQDLQSNEWPRIEKKHFCQIVQHVLQTIYFIQGKLLDNDQLDKLILICHQVFGKLNSQLKYNRRIVSILLKIVQKLFVRCSENIEIVYKKSKSIGLASYLIQIIQMQQCMDNNFQMRLSMLEIIYIYTKLQTLNSQINKEQIVIIGMDLTQKLGLLSFALSFVKYRLEQSYIYALGTIQNTLYLHQYLTSNIEPQLIQMICDLILINHREISYRALDLINDIIYYSEESTEALLRKSFLLDNLHKRLYIEKEIRDNVSKLCIEKCLYILCNVLLTKNRQCKRVIQIHPIWEMIYQSFNQQSPLYSLVSVYEYYFKFLGRKKTLSFLASFIYAVSAINLNSPQKQNQALKRTIQQLFCEAQSFWQQKDLQQFIRILQMYNMKYIVEDFIKCQ